MQRCSVLAHEIDTRRAQRDAGLRDALHED